ncbi:MAG TPA: F0F1 ATP synthase subunit B [Candidatus Paceibacterota bacterium]|nr:F0F1 ATP synthase subunit B [Candidatus Paceibacterota bacterium]
MSALLTSLGIDWKLLIAQAINFAILVYVLRRFVYVPVIDVLEKRRREIAETKEKEKLAGTRLAEIETEKQKILTTAREAAQEILAKAEKASQTQTEESLRLAEEKAKTLISEAKLSLEQERLKIRSEIKSEIGEVVTAAVEKTVGDFLSKEAEAKLKADALAIIRENAEVFK